ncbi:MAG: type II toxin-antitoxin system HicB family antitoxin [Planctomycetota bacterium]|nr:type II toxin-antitoxin system HicB family antitoxin [Planctomycetota bacterium]
MSAKSRKNSDSGKKADSPFDAALWKQSAEIAHGYRLMIQKDPDVGYFGRALEMPMVMADGSTIARCAASTLEALTLAVATMLEQGESPPQPATSEKRSAQINIRVTAEEKLRLEEAAQRLGYRGISDYVRAAAMKEAG